MRPATKDKNPVNAPGVCARCRVGSGVRDYFVDTGMSFDWEGTIYLCNCCLKDIAAAAKEFKTLEEVHDMLSHNNFLASEGAKIMKKRADFYEWAKKVTTLDLAAMELRYDEHVALLEDLRGSDNVREVTAKADGSTGVSVETDSGIASKAKQPSYALLL